MKNFTLSQNVINALVAIVLIIVIVAIHIKTPLMFK